MTTTTHSLTIAGGLLGHALTALGQHIADEQLMAPSTIVLEENPLELIACVSNSWQAWLDTVLIDDEHNAYREPANGILEPFFVTTWKVRLPNSGVRITLRAHRPLPLRAVHA